LSVKSNPGPITAMLRMRCSLSAPLRIIARSVSSRAKVRSSDVSTERPRWSNSVDWTNSSAPDRCSAGALLQLFLITALLQREAGQVGRQDVF